MKSLKVVLCIIFSVALLAACGGSHNSPAPTTAPSAPQGVSAVAGDGQVTIAWNTVSGATAYNVYRDTTSGVTNTPGELIGNGVAGSPYIDNTVTNDTTYYYVVTALNSLGESGPSAVVNATPAAGASSTKPYIAATVLTWTGTPVPGAPALQVAVCTNSTCSTPITDAQVMVGGTTLVYNGANSDYEALTGAPVANGTVSLSVGITNTGDGVATGTYTASGTQFATFPTVTVPVSGETMDPTKNETFKWNAGAPTSGADYVVGIMNGPTFYPTNSNNNPLELPTSSTQYTLPANSTTINGVYTVFVGIATKGIVGQTGGISIPNTASGSGLWIGGISAQVQFTMQAGGSGGTSSLAGSWNLNRLVANTPSWERTNVSTGPLTIDSSGTLSGTSVDWTGVTKAASGTLTVSGGIINSSTDPTFQGAVDSGGTVVAATSTKSNNVDVKMGMLVKQGASYSTSDMDGTWQLYDFESPGAYWFRNTMTITNGSWGLPSSTNTWDGSTFSATNGTISIAATGIMNMTTSSGKGPDLSIQCAMDSGKTVAVCTAGTPGTPADNVDIIVLVKAPSSLLLADMAGTWQMNQIRTMGPIWNRGTMTFGSTGGISSMSLKASDGSTYTTPPTGNATINNTSVDVITAPTAWDENQQCSVDADKTVMVCTAGGPTNGDSAITVLLKQ